MAITRRIFDIGQRRLRHRDLVRLKGTHEVETVEVPDNELRMFTLGAILALASDAHNAFTEFAYASRSGQENLADLKLKEMEGELVDIYALIDEYFKKTALGDARYRSTLAVIDRGDFVSQRVTKAQETRRMR